MRDDNAEQARVVASEPGDVGQRDLAFFGVEGHAEVEKYSLPAGFKLDAGTTDLFASAMNADSHRRPSSGWNGHANRANWRRTQEQAPDPREVRIVLLPCVSCAK